VVRIPYVWALPLLLRAQAYVDSRACAECHPKIAETYACTGMARAFQRLDAPSFQPAAPFLHQQSNTWYAMVRRQDGVYQRRWRIGPDGREIHVRELRADYVMGSGNHARSYLHRTARGTVIELDLAWYPEDGGTWAMAPGHDRDYVLPPRAVAYECMFCHMPKRRTQDVVHAVMTDHLIQRQPPRADPLAPLAERREFDENQYRGEVVPYYPSPLPQTPENALYLAVAQVTQRSNLAKGVPRLAAEIAKQNPARHEFYLELGQAWIAAGKPATAVTAFEAALKRKADSAAAMLGLGDALTEAAQPARAVTVLSRTVKLAPNDALLWYQLAIAHSAAGSDDAAIAAVEKSTAADPDLAEPYNLLGELLAGKGDLARAERSVERALEINPDLPEARGGRRSGAGRVLLRACGASQAQRRRSPDQLRCDAARPEAA
jgi:tetratricopeptide (TPR) repeat protein